MSPFLHFYLDYNWAVDGGGGGRGCGRGGGSVWGGGGEGSGAGSVGGASAQAVVSQGKTFVPSRP